MRRINHLGLSIIEHFEGRWLSPYPCSSGVWTIGAGHAIRHNGRLLRGEADHALALGLYPDQITAADVDAMLLMDAMEAELAVSRLVKIKINDDQFSALGSLCFNIGAGRFSKSDTLRCVNQGNMQGAADNLKWWRMSAGKVDRGLIRRRAAEKALFLGDHIRMSSFLVFSPLVIAAASRYLGFPE